MMGPGHAVGSAVFVLGLGLVEIKIGSPIVARELDPGQVVVLAGTAVPFSFGVLSPDIDQRGWIKERFGHRGAVHWWGWPVTVMIVLAVLGAAPLLAFGPVLGWLSHIWPFDWLFGRGGRSIKRGIPRWPWRSSPRHGLGGRVAAKRSRLEKWIFGTRRTHAVGEWIFTVVLLGIMFGELVMLGQVP